MIKEFPQSRFVSYLAEVNGMNACGYDRFIFFPGMMFNSKEKWWGAKGRRGASHEGLDICFFATTNGHFFRLDETADIPMIYDGEVVHITDDFLGKTVVTRHCFGKSDRRLLSLYGHLSLDKNLAIGDEVSEGEVFAKISGLAGKKKPLPPHMHLSLARPEMLAPADQLEWTYLNTVDRSVFIDPLSVLNLKYQLVEYKETCDMFTMFSRWTCKVKALKLQDPR